MERYPSPLPYPDYSYRSIRGRTFGTTRNKKKQKRATAGQSRVYDCATDADCGPISDRTTIPHLCEEEECVEIRGAHRGVRQGI